MTAPEPRPAAANGNGRGVAVLAMAVVVGVLLLWQFGGGSSSSSSDGDKTSSPNTTAPLGSTTSQATTSSTPTSNHTPSEVKVIVLNGGGPAGTAKSTSSQIESSGYTMGQYGNSPVNVTATTFFYDDGYQEDATAIALLLGKSTDAVKPLSSAGLSGAEGDSNVVVVLGPDAPPVSGTSTSSSTTTTAG